MYQWAVEGSVSGHHSNTHFSSIQVNRSRPDHCQEAALKRKGGFHPDLNDDPRLLTVVLFMENLPENFYPGRFTIASTEMTCPAARFGALVFKAKHPHCGTGAGVYTNYLPANSPFRYQAPSHLIFPDLPKDLYLKMRSNIIAYARNDAMRVRPRELNAALLDEVKSKAVSGAYRNYRTLQMRI